jgi:SET domain-containing protein
MDQVSSPLEGYVYEYSKNKAAVALGNGSLLNHSDKANSDFEFDYKKKMLLIRAIRSISPGEEVTINYRYNPDDRTRFQIF